MSEVTCSSGGSNEGSSKTRRPSPLRAVMPLQAMHRTSPLRLRNRISPDTEISPGLDLSSQSKGRVWGGQNNRGEGAVLMRRTASLDAIYLKGQTWPKDLPAPFSHLLLDKASQTPIEWLAECPSDVSVGCSGCISSTNSTPRRSPGSLPSSPWLSTTQSTHTNTGENLDKFIRQRLQRTNKECASLRYSPVHADHSVLAPTVSRSLVQPQTNGASCKGMSRQLLPKFRSSVEGLNQEIERLVLVPTYQTSEDFDETWGSRQDGRRAPVPDYLRFTRTVNTQTPARGSSCASGTSSAHTTPSLSPTMSPPPVHGPMTPPDSPGPPTAIPTAIATSPQINKFLAREPPDGCERVALKPSSDDRSGSEAGSWPPVQSTPIFTLKPSLGSAFCTPGRLGDSGCSDPRCKGKETGGREGDIPVEATTCESHRPKSDPTSGEEASCSTKQ